MRETYLRSWHNIKFFLKIQEFFCFCTQGLMSPRLNRNLPPQARISTASQETIECTGLVFCFYRDFLSTMFILKNKNSNSSLTRKENVLRKIKALLDFKTSDLIPNLPFIHFCSIYPVIWATDIHQWEVLFLKKHKIR